MATGIALCRHPLTQFGYERLAGRVDMRLLCHPEKSLASVTTGGVAPERVTVYEDYDVNSLVEYDAARIVEEQGCAGVIALSEVDIMRAALLRERYGIAGLWPAAARLFRDKAAMKDRLADAGVSVPRYRTVETGLDLLSAARDFGFPFVVKPRLGGGSVGTRVVRDETALRALLAGGLRHAFYTPAHMEAEEFVDGELCHVDGLVLDGRVFLQTVSRYRSDILEFGAPLSTAMIDPDSPRAVELRGFTGRVLDVLGLLGGGAHSYFHCEVFVTSRGPVLCEVAARPGGLGIVDQVDAYFGVSTFDLLLDATFGKAPEGPAPEGSGVTGWVGIPKSFDPALVRSCVPEPHRALERVHRRSAGTRQISSVDLDGFLVVRGGTADELELLLSRAVSRIALEVAP
ncbi:ATP-grasp domain-containing protein [Streptomyces kurssanovii]|uniref:ATP-grasp domain-containing protein n=1 Tax=Streptomyces kurssanovii TaxID=67312 RepID=A0ABV3HTK0_9ACTN